MTSKYASSSSPISSNSSISSSSSDSCLFEYAESLSERPSTLHFLHSPPLVTVTTLAPSLALLLLVNRYNLPQLMHSSWGSAAINQNDRISAGCCARTYVQISMRPITTTGNYGTFVVQSFSEWASYLAENKSLTFMRLLVRPQITSQRELFVA